MDLTAVKSTRPRVIDLFKYIFMAAKDENPKVSEFDVLFIKQRNNLTLITGAISRPGYYLTDMENIFSIFLKCGGTKQNADLTRVAVLSESNFKVINLNEQNPLQIKDRFKIIYVPKE